MDRINSLPDDIICHTLSFLSTKESALTSLLSKRWRNLFAFTPNLYFDDRYLVYRNSDLDIPRSTFGDFVDRVLAVSGNSPIKKFSLKYGKTVEAARINRWICNVLSRGVLDLDLDAITKNVITLPLEIFSCKTLVKLKLGSGFDVPMVPENVSFPVLKTLVLDHHRFSSNMEALISACHVLEELEIFVNNWDRSPTFSSPTLERLTIYHYFRIDSRDYYRCITFDTPSLAYLHYCGFNANEYRILNLDSLVEANLSLASWVFPNRGNPTNLIKGFKNVKILNLSSYKTSEVLYSFREAIPVFENLSRLSIATAFGSCWKLLPLLLKKSPNLETLVIKGPLHHYQQKSETVCECLSGYSFLLSCPVKVVEITKYSGTKGDLEQVKHFLEKLPCLELVIVHAKEKAKFIIDLLMLSGASKIQFKFSP